MRKICAGLLAIGVLAGVALCASYGWDQATEQKDRIIQAFIYGFVAAVTLALHGGALRLWVKGWRKTGVIVVFIGMLAFVMTSATSLGGLASRSDKVTAERQETIDNKADTKRQIDELTAEKAGMKFRRTTKATVEAAQAVADAAKLAREQECGKVGENCRKRQDAEVAALTKLTEAQENKAATDRFDWIEAELKRLRGLKLGEAVGSADALRALWTRVFGAWGALVSDWQKVAFALIYDLCLVALMLVVEATSPTHAPVIARKPEDEERPELQLTRLGAPPAEAEIITAEPRKLPAPSRPTLVVSNTEAKVGNVHRILPKFLSRVEGEKVEIADVGRRYREVCLVEGLKPASKAEFITQVDRFCKEIRIKRRTINGHLYLIDMQLEQVDRKTVKA